MSGQLTIDFTTQSPINQEKLTGQNKQVFDWMAAGNTINCIQAQEMNITALNSRISDLRNRAKVMVYDRFITTPGGSKIKEYSLTPFESK